MNIRVIALSGLLVLSHAACGDASAAPSADGAGSALPQGQVALVVDAKEYMTRINNTLALAARGEYGRLSPGQDSRLRAARDRISSLLQGHATTTELEGRERVALINAEETIKSILRNQDGDRMVCTRSAGTGSRLAVRECLTVAEREARAAEAKRLVREQTRSSWGGVAQ